jgi:hypothetical protein
LHYRHISMYFILENWSGCLTVWITDALCAIFNATHLSG